MQPGITIKDRYRLTHQVGVGGMGTVWHAVDLQLDRQVAVKLVRTGQGSHPSFPARFRREAKLAASLNHPAIVTVHDFGEHEGTWFIVMEWLAGGSLQGEITESGGGSVARALALGVRIAEGLADAHACGIVHRDIKPANILLRSKGGDQVKIGDFGLARTDDASAITSAGFQPGTPLYQAPEQWLGEAVGPRTDLYAFGCLLYALVAGAPPFRGEPPALLRQHLDVRPAPLREHRPGVPEALDRLIMGLLAKAPEDRPASAAAVADRLRAISDSLSASPASASPTSASAASASPASASPASASALADGPGDGPVDGGGGVQDVRDGADPERTGRLAVDEPVSTVLARAAGDPSAGETPADAGTRGFWSIAVTLALLIGLAGWGWVEGVRGVDVPLEYAAGQRPRGAADDFGWRMQQAGQIDTSWTARAGEDIVGPGGELSLSLLEEQRGGECTEWSRKQGLKVRWKLLLDGSEVSSGTAGWEAPSMAEATTVLRDSGPGRHRVRLTASRADDVPCSVELRWDSAGIDSPGPGPWRWG